MQTLDFTSESGSRSASRQTPTHSAPNPGGTAPATPDMAAVKRRQQATWASGDYAVIGTSLQIVGETLAESADLRAGWKVIDVAAGNGNATLAAARRYAAVTSTDYVPALLEKGQARARAEGLQVQFKVADAEALPFGDGSFDAALSVFGSMFTPDHTRTASEMLRVVRRGGRLAIASWTPDSFIGQVFRVIAQYAPPPVGVKSPLLWGTEPHVVELFGREALDIRASRKMFNFRYRSAAHWIEVFRNYYGPVHRTFASLDAYSTGSLEADLMRLIDRCNIGGKTAMVVPSEYLEVVIDRR